MIITAIDSYNYYFITIVIITMFIIIVNVTIINHFFLFSVIKYNLLNIGTMLLGLACS